MYTKKQNAANTDAIQLAADEIFASIKAMEHKFPKGNASTKAFELLAQKLLELDPRLVTASYSFVSAAAVEHTRKREISIQITMKRLIASAAFRAAT